jgi:hypothetical protein
MRKHLIWVLGLVLAVGVASVAIGANTHTIKAKITPSKQKKIEFGPATLDFTTTASCVQPCGGPGAVNRAARLRISFDDDLRVFTRGLARCSASQIEGTTTPAAKARCRRAQVGFGSGTALIGGDPATAVPVLFTTFNGVPRGGKPTLLIHSRTDALGFTTLVTAVLKPASGDFGTLVDATVPPLPYSTALISFQNKLQKSYFFRGQRRQVISARCFDRDRTWNFKGVDTYIGNTPPNLTATATQKCTVKR